MTHSTLAKKSIAHQNKFNSREGAAITRVIVHHWAGTSGGDVTLADPNREASANYILYSDGSLAVQVPEEYRAWTSGGYAIDQPSITVEVQNSTNGPDWKVSDAAIKTLTALIADIARRYKWGRITRDRVRGHREFAATACPGPYLYPLLGTIVTNANIPGGVTPTKPVKPITGQEEDEDMGRNVCVATAHEKTYRVRVFELAAGEEHQFSSADTKYIANVAKTYGCTMVSYITNSHYAQIGKELADTRKRLAAA